MGRRKETEEEKKVKEYLARLKREWADMEQDWASAAKDNSIASMNNYDCPYCTKFMNEDGDTIKDMCGKCPLFKKLRGKDQRWCNAELSKGTLMNEYMWTKSDTEEKKKLAKKFYRKILKDKGKYFPEI